MSREITITLRIKEDKNHEDYLKVIKDSKKKIEDMKKSGIIDVFEIFKTGVNVGITLGKLKFEVVDYELQDKE